MIQSVNCNFFLISISPNSDMVFIKSFAPNNKNIDVNTIVINMSHFAISFFQSTDSHLFSASAKSINLSIKYKKYSFPRLHALLFSILKVFVLYPLVKNEYSENSLDNSPSPYLAITYPLMWFCICITFPINCILFCL